MLKKLAILLAVLVPAIALAGGPVNPPGPTPITCTGGNSVVAYPGYGQPLTCGTGTATGTISAGVAGQLADYTAATTIGPITTGTGVVTALGVNTGSAGAFLVNGGALGTPASGTLTNATGLPIATGVSGLGAGVATFLATPSSANLLAAMTTKTGTGLNVFNTAPSISALTLSDVATGTQCLHANAAGLVSGTGSDCGAGGGGAFSGLTSGTNTTAAMVVGTGASLATSGSGTIAATSIANTAVTPGSYTNANITVTADGRLTAASTGSAGAATGAGVDGGTANVTITASCTLGTTAACISHNIRLVKIGTLAAAITVTLDAIANVSADSAVCIDDSGNISASHTLTVAASSTDTAASGGIVSSGGTVTSVGPYTNAGDALCFRVTGTHLWTMEASSTLAASSAPANQFANGVSLNGLTYAQPSVSNLSGLGTGVATAAGNALSANGGLTTTIASGQQALATAAIASATCATTVQATATNTTTSDTVLASFSADPTAVTGYVPLTTGMLTIVVFPTAGFANFRVCNNTNASITPGAITLNWRVVR